MSSETSASSGPQATEPSEQVSDPSSVLQGVLAGIGILGIVLSGFLLEAFFPSMVMVSIFAGAFQWLLVIPLALLWSFKGRRAAVKGLLIIAGIATLLSATCTGLVVYLFSQGGGL